MILEVAMLNIKPGQGPDFEKAFLKAAPIIMSMGGYISHELQRCLEVHDRYVLLVRWEKLEDHTKGFRESPLYEQWKSILHVFYDPFPTVEHFENVI